MCIVTFSGYDVHEEDVCFIDASAPQQRITTTRNNTRTWTLRFL